MAILRIPLLVFGSVVARLRRLPGATALSRHAFWVICGLLVLAFLALLVWGLERSPQRVAMADLAAGALSPMQSWIIVSGNLETQESRISAFGYWLTDPAAPNAGMTVFSEVELPLGPATVSGTYIGPREPVPPGHTWIGHMRADAIQVSDHPPPWVAILFALAALTVAAATRVAYPMFFGASPASAAPRPMEVPVEVRRGPLNRTDDPVQGRLQVDRGGEVSLQLAGGPAQRLRLHSVHTGVDVGELHKVSSSVPSMRVRQSTDELTISFASAEDRDTAAAALAAEAAGWLRDLRPEST